MAKYTGRVFWSVLAAVLTIGLSSGCHEFPDMTVDDLPPPGMVSTASADHVRRMNPSVVERVREFEPRTIESQDGTVTHGPLWFEDPFELVGSDDDQFAVTWEDGAYLFPLGMARFTANMLLLPVSMVVDLPGKVMCSDGRAEVRRFCGVGELRDSTPCSGVTEPPDVHGLWGAMGDVTEPSGPMEDNSGEAEGQGETPDVVDE